MVGFVSRFASGLAAGLVVALAAIAPAAAQSPPSLQQYPLYDRFFGPGGAFFPNYVTPSVNGFVFLTGAAPRAIFAAGTADYNCQPSQAPTITAIALPPGGRIGTRIGGFTATGTDNGIGWGNRCIGEPVGGTVVTYKGPPGRVTLRVAYPPQGLWYTHAIVVR